MSNFKMNYGSKETDSPGTFKIPKTLSLSKGLFGVDTTIENVQKKASIAKKQFFDTLGNKTHALSGAPVRDTSFFKDKENWYPRHNFDISKDGNVSMEYNISRRGSLPSTKPGSYKKGSYTIKELNVKPSWTRDGRNQANHFDYTRLSGDKTSNFRTFKNAQKAKDKIVIGQRVNQAKKTIYGDYSKRLFNKFS